MTSIMEHSPSHVPADIMLDMDNNIDFFADAPVEKIENPDNIDDLIKKPTATTDVKTAEEELIKRIAPRLEPNQPIVRSKTRKQHLQEELFNLEKEKAPEISKLEFLKQSKKFTIGELESMIEAIKTKDMTDKIIAVEKCRDPSLDVDKLKAEIEKLPETEVQKKLADVTTNAIISKPIMNEELGVRTLMMLNLMTAHACEIASVPLLEKYDIPVDIRGWCHNLQTTKKEELQEVFRQIFRKYYSTIAPLMDPLIVLVAINFSSLHDVIMENASKKKALASQTGSNTTSSSRT